MKLGRGWKPDPAGHRTTNARHLFSRIGAAPPPRAASLRDHVPGVWNQLVTDSCVGHAIVGSVETRSARLGVKLPPKSRVAPYDHARIIDRVPDADGRWPRLTDDGCEPNQAFRGVAERGICPYEDRPTDPATINDEPGLLEYEDDWEMRLDGTYEIDPADTRLIQTSIANGFPILFATLVDRAFEDNAGAIVGAVDPARALGGHYLYAVEYDVAPSGLWVVGFVNSWGETWGEAGFGRGDESFVAGWRDVRVADFRPVG